MVALQPSLQELFFKGSFKELSLHASDFSNLNPEEKVYVVAGLVLTGEVSQAQALAQNALTHTPHVAGTLNFYLALSKLRSSQYKEAQALCLALQKLFKKYPTHDLIGFYFFQTQAALAFYQAQYSECVKSSEKALACAYRAESQLSCVMAEDILGQALYLSGNIHEGIGKLRNSLKRAVQFKIRSAEKALRITLLKFELRTETQQKKNFEQLKKFNAKVKADDHFSANEFRLEYFRQLLLLGSYNLAEQHGKNISADIYSQNIPRQVARLKLQQSQLAYLRSNDNLALKYCDAAEEALAQTHDLPLVSHLRGLRHKIYSRTGQHKERKSIELELLRSSKHSDSFLNSRILARTIARKTNIGRGQDLLGDFLDDLHAQGKAKFKDLISNNLLGLVPQIYKLNLQCKTLLLDAESKEVLICTQHGIARTQNPLPALPLRLLYFIGMEPQSKAELVQKVWGYEYHPFRHDSLLHATLTRLRSEIELDDNFIKLNDGKYSLDKNCRIVWIHSPPLASAKEANPIPYQPQNPETPALAALQLTAYIELNQRQIELINSLKVGEFLKITSYIAEHKISHMTAFRDLNKLCQMNYLLATGKARSRRYLKIT